MSTVVTEAGCCFAGVIVSDKETESKVSERKSEVFDFGSDKEEFKASKGRTGTVSV